MLQGSQICLEGKKVFYLYSVILSVQENWGENLTQLQEPEERTLVDKKRQSTGF